MARLNRVGEEKLNNQGCLMRIVEYNNAHDIIVEFQEPYYKTKSNWSNFVSGKIKNPYYPSVYEVGVIGEKYPIYVDGKKIKEYNTWCSMLERCYSKKYKDKYQAYKDAICCNEWLYFDNFYEWLHSQENFDKWINGDRWHIDKDILVKGNQLYSPNTCCLVPINVNVLFVNHNTTRGNLPIGVHKNGNGYNARCRNPFNNNKSKDLGTYSFIEQSFQAYKTYKEDIVKQIAKIEYDKGNITKDCYNAMINYEVEITD